MGATSCSSTKVKIYYIDPDQGLVRKQENEVIPFKDARGYYATSQRDMEYILNFCLGPHTKQQKQDLLNFLISHE